MPWASATEANLFAAFNDVDLFVELDISGDELERLTRFFGVFLGRQVASGADVAALLDACPALTVATLLTRAARFNEISQLSREYWSGLGLEPTEERIALLEGGFAQRLTAAGLDPMDAVAAGPDGELGRLFAHVGVASDWVPELIEAIDTRRMEGTAEADAEAEAAAIVASLADESRQLGPLCATAPEVAARIVRPVVDIVAHAAAHPLSWEYTLPKTAGPRLIIEDVIEELRERPAGTLNRRHMVGVAHHEDQPRLRLDVRRRRVVLRLPAQQITDPARDEIRWRVDLDGQPEAFRTMRTSQPGRDETEVLDIPVRQPLRELSVRNTLDGQHWVLPMVSNAAPVLVFSARGGDLSQMATLHHAQVYIVVPADSHAIDPVQGQDIPVLRELPMKTWDGWVIRYIDLTNALSLHIARPGDRAPMLTTVRAVDPRQRVQFLEPDEPIVGIETASGKGIHSESLQVEFPPTVSGDEETWFLSVSAYAGPGESGDEVSEEEPLEVPAEGGVFDVFDPEAWDSPWVGEYLVRLRGPRNESFRHEYALIEGLRVETELQGPSPRTRLPMVGGLSPATVRLLPGAKPFEKLPAQKLSATDIATTPVVETDAGDALPIVVNPTRLRYQLALRGDDPMWRTEPMVVPAVWIDPETKFRVRPGTPISKPRIVVRNHHGTPVRTLDLTTVDNITWWVDLGRTAASLKLMRSGTIELEFLDGKQVSVRLARIIPDFTFTPASEAGELVISSADAEPVGDAQPIHPLTHFDAWVWPNSAPWEPARTVALTFDAATQTARGSLPEELVDAGELSVQLFNRDQFNVLRPPVSAGKRAKTIAAKGFFGADDGRWGSLSAFLSGESEDLPDTPEILSTLWDVQAGWLQGRFESLGKLSQALTHNPRESVHAMSQSLVPAADRPAQFIASGLVHSRLIGSARDRSDTPWIAALEILGDLSVTDDESRQARLLRQELMGVAGDPIGQTVQTGRDASLDTACIDSTTVQIAHMDPAQQKAVLDMFFGGAGLVPGALSEENSRLIAVFETFEKRGRLSELLGDPVLMKTAVATLRRVKQTNRQLYLSARVRFDRLDGVDTNDPANRWALTPVISMIFALATRMHAHGHLPSLGQLTAAYPGWANLAQMVPDLVVGDLVMADAMVLGVFGPQEPAPETEEPEATAAEEPDASDTTETPGDTA